jgi:CelD/BcsL family acetyltransferase involved in cellulose biosynthesis
VQLTIRRLSDLTAVEVRAWQDLAASATEPNPNADPRFLLSSLGHGLGAEKIQVALVRASDGGMRMVLPFTRGDRIAGIPARHLTTHGSFVHEFASKNHPLLSAHEPVAAVRALFAGLRRSPFPDLVDFTVLPVDSVIMDALRELHDDGSVRMIERVRDARAYARRNDLAPAGETGWYAREGDVLSFPVPHLSARTRRSLGQYGRQIERTAGGPLELSVHDDDPRMIEEFLDLQAAGWKGDDALTGPQFRRKGQEAWFRGVVDRFRADGDLRVLRLSAAGKTVYLAVYVVSGGRTFGFHDVFDEAFRKSSPGFVGRLAQLGHVLAEPGAAPFDPGMEPWYTQANSAFPSRREHANVLVAGRSARSRAVVRLLPVAKRLRDAVRPTSSGGEE